MFLFRDIFLYAFDCILLFTSIRGNLRLKKKKMKKLFNVKFESSLFIKVSHCSAVHSVSGICVDCASSLSM